MESISDFIDGSMMNQIISVYADKGYDSTTIREYLKNRNIKDCIPYRSFKINNNKIKNHTNYNKTRYVVEQFFAWLKCGLHRTRIRYERKAENYLGLIHIACIMMYFRVLG